MQPITWRANQEATETPLSTKMSGNKDGEWKVAGEFGVAAHLCVGPCGDCP